MQLPPFPRISLAVSKLKSIHLTCLTVCLTLRILTPAHRFCLDYALANKLVLSTSLLWALQQGRVYDCDYQCGVGASQVVRSGVFGGSIPSYKTGMLRVFTFIHLPG